LIEEWDYNRNEVNLEKVTYGSNKKVWWLCKKCNHGWEAFVYNRALGGDGCPACVGRAVTDRNNLAVTHPHLMDEWNFDKNELRPEGVTFCSRRKVWWVCKVCAYEWKAIIPARSKKEKPTGCPSCAGNVVSDKNRFSLLCSELASEWDFDKNKLSPDEVSYASGKRVWWVCGTCGYSWRAIVRDRFYGSGCPDCTRGPVSKISQEWLNRLNIPQELREYRIDVGNTFVKVDGFDPETNTVYEFLGDYWHGNPEVYSPEKMNEACKKSFGKLYKNTLRRLRLLEESGFNVVYIWEKDFICLRKGAD